MKIIDTKLMIMRKMALIITLAIMAPSLLLTGHVHAKNSSSPWIIDQYTKSRLFVGGYDKSKNILHLGWQISLKEGWKTYWRSPGDAGLPPRWTWTKNRNSKKITVNWPAPKLLNIFGMDTYVYFHEVVLPINMEISDGQKPTSILLDLEYMICAEICIPKEGRYSLDLPILDDIEVSLFQKAQLDRHMALVPPRISGDGIKIQMDMDQKNRILIDLPDTIHLVDTIIIEGPDGFLFGRPKLRNITNHNRFIAPYNGDQAIKGQRLTLTLLYKNGTASETSVTVQP